MDQQVSAKRIDAEALARHGRARPFARDVLVVAGLLAGFILTLLWLVSLQRHFLVLIGLWTALAIAGVLLVRRPMLRTAALMLAALSTMLFMAEAAAVLLRPVREPVRLEGECPTGGRFDPYLLGHGPREPVRKECRRLLGDRPVYDFTYSLDEHGLRETPGNPAGDTILVFGCSFTFGIGVDDSETLPAQLSRELGLRYNLLNLAFNGYGPHHMLRILEEGLPGDTIASPVRRVFYVAIPDQVHRAAGLYWWGQRAPRYAIDADGEARFVAGEFDWLLPLVPPRGLRHSLFFAWAWQVAVDTLMRRTGWQLDLYEAILRRSARLVRERFAAPLTVVLWDDDSDLSNAVRQRLDRLGLETILVSAALPATPGAAYAIPRDGHPSALANRLLAERLAPFVED